MDLSLADMASGHSRGRYWQFYTGHHPTGSVIDVRSFIGLCGFCQRFVADYATVAAPLTDLTQKDKEWAWLPVQQRAFETLKACLLQAPVLINHDHTKPYVLHTDESDVCV